MTGRSNPIFKPHYIGVEYIHFFVFHIILNYIYIRANDICGESTDIGNCSTSSIKVRRLRLNHHPH